MSRPINLRTLSDCKDSPQRTGVNHGARIAKAQRGCEVSYIPNYVRAYVDSPDQTITKNNHQALSRAEWHVVMWLVKDRWSDHEVINYAKEKRFSYYTSHARRNPHDPEGDLKRKIVSVRAYWEDKGYLTSCSGGVFQRLNPKQLSPQRVIDDGVVRGQSQAQFVRDCQERYGCCRQTPHNLLRRGKESGVIHIDEGRVLASARAPESERRIEPSRKYRLSGGAEECLALELRTTPGWRPTAARVLPAPVASCRSLAVARSLRLPRPREP